MSTVPENKLRVVRGLLAQAEDPATTEAEAAVYMARATELMAKYGIDAALAAERQPANDTPTMKEFRISGSRAAAKVFLLMSVADALRCQSLRFPTRDNIKWVRIFGFQSDIDRAEVLYTSLLVQMANGLASTPVPDWVSTVSFRNSWQKGFANKVAARLKEADATAAEEATHTTGRSTGLVLRDRAQAVRDLMNAKEEKINKPRTYQVNLTGYRAGEKAGTRADIGQDRIGTRAALAR